MNVARPSPSATRWRFAGLERLEMNKKLLCLLLIVALLLVACGSGDEEEATATAAPEIEVSEPTVVPESEVEEAVTIRFAILDFQQALFGDLISAFEEENPDIEIKTVSVEEVLELPGLGADWPEDAVRRLVSAADVSSYFYSSDEALRDEVLLDLQPFMDSDPNFDEDDFQPMTLEHFQSQGGTWAVPMTANYQLLFYNKDLFDEAGIDYPQAGWSWDDFLATAKELTVGEGEEKEQWGFVEASPNPAVMIQSRTGTLFDMDTDPPSVNLDDPAVADALRWYTDLYLVHEVSPYYPPPEEDSTGLDIPEGYLTIEGGGAAMWPEATAAFPYRSQQMNLGVVPFPADSPDAAANPLFPEGLSVSVGTANPEAAWRWVNYLSRQSMDLGALFGGASTLPARRSTAEASGFWDEVDEDLGAALEYASEHAFTLRGPGGGLSALSEAFEAVMDGDKTVEAALADAQIAAEEAIEEGLAEGGEPAEEIVVEESDSEQMASDDAVTVDFLALTGQLEAQAFRDLAEQFLEVNPEVIVELKQPNFTGGTPTIEGAAAASDCFQWFPGSFNDPSVQEAILNVDPFLDADGDIQPEDFYPAVFEAFIAQGQTWGIPGQVNINLIEYNKDLFDAAEIDYPSPDWTLEDFLETAVILTQGEDENKQYGYVSGPFEPSDMLSLLDRFGVTLVDDTSDPPALVVNDPAMIEAVRWYTGLTLEHEVKPVLLTNLLGAAASAVQERESLLAEGRAAMWLNAAFNVDLSGDAPRGYETGAVPLPAGSGESQGAGFQSATGYFISAETEQREACWQWIKFLTENVGLGNGLPARRDVAESEAFRQHVGNELADAYLASIGSATEPPFAQQITGENGWLNYPVLWVYTAYDKIITGELGVEEALEDAQQLIDEYRACVIEADAFTDDEGQKTCMLETDETLPPILFGSGE